MFDIAEMLHEAQKRCMLYCWPVFPNHSVNLCVWGGGGNRSTGGKYFLDFTLEWSGNASYKVLMLPVIRPDALYFGTLQLHFKYVFRTIYIF